MSPIVALHSSESIVVAADTLRMPIRIGAAGPPPLCGSKLIAFPSSMTVVGFTGLLFVYSEWIQELASVGDASFRQVCDLAQRRMKTIFEACREDFLPVWNGSTGGGEQVLSSKLEETCIYLFGLDSERAECRSVAIGHETVFMLRDIEGLHCRGLERGPLLEAVAPFLEPRLRPGSERAVALIFCEHIKKSQVAPGSREVMDIRPAATAVEITATGIVIRPHWSL